MRMNRAYKPGIVLFFLLLTVFPLAGCAFSRAFSGKDFFKGAALTPPDKTLAEQWQQQYGNSPVIMEQMETIDEISPDLRWSGSQHYVQRIQNENGKNAGEVKIYYSRGDELSFEAFTITPDGKRFGPSLVQDMADQSDAEANQGAAMYSDDRVKVLTMPHVTAGSRIEVSWKRIRKESRKKEDDFVFGMTAYMPIMAERNVLILPRNLSVRMESVSRDGNLDHPVRRKRGTNVEYVWERYLVDRDQSPRTLYISWNQSWGTVAARVWKKFERNVVISPQMKDTVRQLTQGKSSAMEKAQAIVDFISSQFRYVALEFNGRRVEPRRADEVFRTRYGDCKDYTIVTMAMLKEAGISAFPMLVSTTAEYDPESKPPANNYFNHIMPVISPNGKDQYAVEVQVPGYPVGFLPSSYNGKHSFVIEGPSRFYFFTMKSPFLRAESRTAYTYTLHEDGSIVGELVTEYDDESSLLYLGQNPKVLIGQSFKPDQEDSTGRTRVIERKFEQIKNGIIVVRDTFESRGYASVAGDTMIFGPGKQFFTPCFDRSEKNMFLPPVQPVCQTEINRVTIPAGFEFVHVPKDLQLKNVWVDFSRTYAKTDKEIVITQRMERFSDLSNAGAYQGVRETNEKICAMTGDMVCIRRKKQP